jgi:hypothetical protein
MATKIITKSIAETMYMSPAQVKMGTAKNSPRADGASLPANARTTGA